MKKPRKTKPIIKKCVLVNYMPNIWEADNYIIKYRDYKLTVSGPLNFTYHINGEVSNYLTFEELKHHLSKRFDFQCQETYEEAECPLFSHYFWS